MQLKPPLGENWVCSAFSVTKHSNCQPFSLLGLPSHTCLLREPPLASLFLFFLALLDTLAMSHTNPSPVICIWVDGCTFSHTSKGRISHRDEQRSTVRVHRARQLSRTEHQSHATESDRMPPFLIGIFFSLSFHPGFLRCKWSIPNQRNRSTRDKGIVVSWSVPYICQELPVMP